VAPSACRQCPSGDNPIEIEHQTSDTGPDFQSHAINKTEQENVNRRSPHTQSSWMPIYFEGEGGWIPKPIPPCHHQYSLYVSQNARTTPISPSRRTRC
jgi:hypothetical protein